jgi:hypothetical protein
MIRIRYAYTKEADISGAAHELRNVRQLLLHFIQSSEQSFTIQTDTAYNPEPYDLVIEKLIVVKSDHFISVEFDTKEKSVAISAAPYFLNLFAEYFDFSEETFQGYHAHFEYYEDHPFIAENSVPLVISVQ